MNAESFVQLIAGLVFLVVIMTLIMIMLSSRKKSKVLNRYDILSDELERQKKENIHLKSDLKRINSMDNLFFASMIRLTSKLNPAEIAKEVAGLLEDYLNTDEVAVFLSDERRTRLTIAAQYGLNDDWLPRLVYELDYKDGKGKVGYSFEKNLPVGEQEHRILEIKEPYPIFNPDICYPISFQDKKFGVIAISRKNAFEERERNFIGVVSNIAGVALNNTRSFADITFTAHTDPLTKLFNIGHFKERLAEELDRSKRFQHNLSVTIIDLDKFKEYNDTYGHQAGDHLLVQLASIFRKHFDDTNTLARYGGDEFIVMCPEIKKQDVTRNVTDLLHNLEMYDFARGKEQVRVSFSAGVSCYPDDAANVSELIKLADEALYEAKDAGRNRVCAYHPKIENI